VTLKIGEYDSNDKVFIRQYREQLHVFLFKVARNHHYSLINLRTMYSLIACTILEVPCGLTAAAASCLAMTIQDFAVTAEELPDKSRYWLHAIVLSIISLICWVHKAPDLYRYVNEIVSRRAKDAPQLNPALLKTYKEYNKYTYWKKPMLYFEDWELRYGL
ncbi:jg25052, partial [Pararge aegeria aegeria]